jgi:hypothetical protein
MNLKKIALSGVAVAGLLLATPALAAPAGYVGGNYVRSETDPGGGKNDGWAVDGSVALDTGSALGVAVNGTVGDDDSSDTNWGAGGHVFTKVGNGLAGGFAKYQDAGNNAEAWGFGAEGQYNFTGFTAGAAATWLNPDSSALYDDAWGLDGQAKVYATDNLRLSGNVGYGKYKGKGFLPDDNEWTVGVGAEWQLASLPISIVGDYAHVDFDKANTTSDAFRIGGRFTFGGTLKDRNDSGADLHTISTLGSRFGF